MISSSGVTNQNAESVGLTNRWRLLEILLQLLKTQSFWLDEWKVIDASLVNRSKDSHVTTTQLSCTRLEEEGVGSGPTPLLGYVLLLVTKLGRCTTGLTMFGQKCGSTSTIGGSTWIPVRTLSTSPCYTRMAGVKNLHTALLFLMWRLLMSPRDM